MLGWADLYHESASWSVDLLHVLATMLAQKAKLPDCTCPSCARVKDQLEKMGYLKRRGGKP
jgi:hypothetical protein